MNENDITQEHGMPDQDGTAETTYGRETDTADRNTTAHETGDDAANPQASTPVPTPAASHALKDTAPVAQTTPGNATSPQDSAQPAEPKPRRKRRIVKKIVWAILLLLLAYLVYTVLYVYLTPDRKVRQIYLVPRDAALIIQSSEPVADWRAFSTSEPWQAISRAPSFAEITAQVLSLDSMVHDNQTLLGLVGRRDMIISLHKTRADDWDFLVLIDMRKASKLDLLKDQIEQILKLTGSDVTRREYKGITITEMHDRVTRDILHLAFVDNHLAASYNVRLLQAAIDERSAPAIGLDDHYLRADRLVSNHGLFRLYVNYAVLPQFLSLYLGQSDAVEAFSRSMDFAGLWFDVKRDRMEMKGYTLMKEEPAPYVQALLGSGRHRMKAHEIMSARTALYINLGFDNPKTFVAQLEKALRESDQSSYDAYAAARKLVERYFDLSLDKNLLGWMAGEFAVAQLEPGLLGREPELIVAVRANNIRDARREMDELGQKIRRRSPVKVRTLNYKDYPISQIEIKGFFKMLLGNAPGAFDELHYTFVDDFVVFSNKPSSLLSFIEDNEQKNLLPANDEFRRALAQADINSTVFGYVDMPRFFPQLRKVVNPQTWTALAGNEEVMASFPQWIFQIVGEGAESSMQLWVEYKPYEPEATVVANDTPEEAPDEAVDEDAESEKELMNELKRFYVEKFEGNVLREFYDDGSLKSESETRRGKRHGRYREYWPDGSLHIRGRYADNRPRGTWKYYTPDGAFERKEKY